jgi:hypothetical protein
MFSKQLATGVGIVAGLAGLIVAATPRLQADDDHNAGTDWKVEQGLHIAPVHLSYDSHNREAVGLGSYIVNAVSECNGCHSAGPATEYAVDKKGGVHNPYLRPGFFAPPKAVNRETYLGGGRDFGQVGPITSDTVPPHIISRNLTPDKSGLPEGGATFAEFHETIRRGIDHDHLHPNCNGTTITSNCFNPPFNGDLLQVMPWPAYQDWTEGDLVAVYEYLKAIPCVAGPGHDCQ